MSEAMPTLDKQIIAAAQSGDLAGVRAALAAGARVRASSGRPLQEAAAAGHTEIVQCLLEAGANTRVSMITALCEASMKGHPAVVEVLIHAGASFLDGRALLWAAQAGKDRVVTLLLQHGALVAPGSTGRFILDNLCLYPPAVQVAMIQGRNNALTLPVTTYARRGVCPEGLCALLERRGKTELATMLSATRMLEPLPPLSRAELLGELMAKPKTQETTLVGPC